MKKILAIYPGLFQPFHCGHQNILDKSEKIFGDGNVIIVVEVNSENIDEDKRKLMSFLGSEEILKNISKKRVEVLQKQLPSKNIESYMGFLSEYVREKEKEGYNVIVILGVRNGYDFDDEYNNCRFCWDQFPEMNIIIIPCDPIFTHVSSSKYRQLEKIKPGAGYKYLARKNEQ